MPANFLDLKRLPINTILIEAIKQDASDVHLVVGKPPVFRVHGRLIDQGNIKLDRDDTERLAIETMSEKVENIFKRDLEADYSYSIDLNGVSYRFRINTFTQKGNVSVVMRLIPTEIKSIDALGLPEILKDFTYLPRGLVLVTGPTGSGKSTTLASMIDAINRNRDVNIITIEDPIEYVHEHKKSIIVQREIGQDSLSFAKALKSILREDPDVILLGEMRDLETIATAVTLAETGHLVFATLHTTSASQTVDRIIDVFPPEQQEQIRVQLANVLEAIVSQTLIPKVDGGRVCATEILIMNAAARANIRQAKSSQLNDIMQMNSKIGMHTLEQRLVMYVKKNLITTETAMKATSRPDVLQQMLNRKI